MFESAVQMPDKRTEAGRSVVDDWRKGLKRRAGGRTSAGDHGRNASFLKEVERMNDQRLARKLQERLVPAHAAGLAAREHESKGVGLWIAMRRILVRRILPGRIQLPTSSRKRMSDSMPSSKFFRLNFSLGAWILSSGRPKPIITLGRPR